jgi:hypothetical protein
MEFRIIPDNNPPIRSLNLLVPPSPPVFLTGIGVALRSVSYSNIAFFPVVLIQRVGIDRKAVRAVAKARLQFQSVNGVLGSILGGVNANKLDIFLSVVKNVEMLNDK